MNTHLNNPYKNYFRPHRKIVAVHSVHRVIKHLVRLCNSEEISLRDMAKRVGVSHMALSHWVNGHSSPSVDNIEACLNVLGYHLEARENKHDEL